MSMPTEMKTIRSDIFKNPLGGLGQYYLGPLRDEYFILVGNARTGIKYTIENGEPLAKSYLLIRDTPHVRLYGLNVFRMRGSRL